MTSLKSNWQHALILATLLYCECFTKNQIGNFFVAPPYAALEHIQTSDTHKDFVLGVADGFREGVGPAEVLGHPGIERTSGNYVMSAAASALYSALLSGCIA